MLDTLLTIAMFTLPTARPNMERIATISAPAQGKAIVVQVASVKPTNNLTTCYEVRNGECWGDN